MGWHRDNIFDIGRFVKVELENKKNKKENQMIQNAKVPIKKEKLRQISLLVNFKNNYSGHRFKSMHQKQQETEKKQKQNINNKSDSNTITPKNMYDFCPELVVSSIDGRVIDPWSASFYVRGVDSVFKRFYFFDCQMQILLTQEYGQKIIKLKNKGNLLKKQNETEFNMLNQLLWDIIFNATCFYLNNPPQNISDLTDNYLITQKTISGLLFFFVFFCFFCVSVLFFVFGFLREKASMCNMCDMCDMCDM